MTEPSWPDVSTPESNHRVFLDLDNRHHVGSSGPGIHDWWSILKVCTMA